MNAAAAVAVGLLAGSALGVSVRPVLRALPEPRAEDGTPVPDKRPYAQLASPGFAVVLALVSAALIAVAAYVLPSAAVPQWVVLGTAGLLLAGIDARTTWLPLTLTRVAWALAVVSAAVGAVLAGAGGAVDLLLRISIGALAAGLLYWLVWRVSRGGLGFGDVRFAPLVGAAAGAAGWSLIWWSLVLGAVVQGLWGGWRLIRRQRDPFPYAPAMLAGAWLALACSVIFPG